LIKEKSTPGLFDLDVREMAKPRNSGRINGGEKSLME
jgi:hypothetical protein